MSDVEKSFVGDAAKRARAAIKARRKPQMKNEYTANPTAGWDQRPNWKGMAGAATLVGGAGAAGYYGGSRPPQQPMPYRTQQMPPPPQQGPMVKSYDWEEVEKFNPTAALKTGFSNVKATAKGGKKWAGQHKKMYQTDPAAYRKVLGNKTRHNYGRAKQGVKNYFSPGGKPNYKRIGGWSAAGAGAAGATGYAFGKSDDLASRKRDSNLGLGSNLLGAGVGTVATGQAAYVAAQHMKNKKNKVPEHRPAVVKPDSFGRKAKRILGGKKTTAVLVPAALITNIPFQAGNAAADANSAKFFAQERGRLKALEAGVKKSAPMTVDEHKFQLQQSKDKYYKYRGMEKENQLKANMSALAGTGAAGGLGFAAGNAKSQLARGALGFGAATAGAAGLLSMAQHQSRAKMNARSKNIQGDSAVEHRMALDDMTKSDEGLAKCYEGPERTGVGTNMNLPTETVSKQQRIFHGWDPDAQRKRDNYRKAGTAAAATSGLGAATLVGWAANDIRRADKTVGQRRQEDKIKFEPGRSARKKKDYTTSDWARTKNEKTYGGGDAGKHKADFTQHHDKKNREKRDRVRQQQRDYISDKGFQSGRTYEARNRANPLKETGKNLKAVAEEANKKGKLAGKLGGAAGLAALGTTAYKLTHGD